MRNETNALSDTLPCMTWTLPLPLLLFVGAVAFVAAWPRLRRPVSVPRLMAEVFAITLAVIAAFWLGWVILWLIEQRW